MSKQPTYTPTAFDCSSTAGYCPVCTPTLTPGQLCTGVIGANAGGANQQCPSSSNSDCKSYIYGASSTIMDELRNTDSSPPGVLCGGDGTTRLGGYSGSGHCLPTRDNSIKEMKTTPLIVGSKILNSAPTTKNPSDWKDFPIQAVHKAWGSAGGTYNNGVNARNVYMGGDKEKVKFKMDGNSKTASQRVLYMEAHGDKYRGDVQGVKQDGVKPSPFSGGPQCPNWVILPPGPTGKGNLNANQRVGGVACTKDQYGPGIYNILCYVPPTTDTGTGKSAASKGRGYVFSAWTFHYEEIYIGGVKDQGPPNTTVNSQARGELRKQPPQPKFPCYNSCDPPNAHQVMPSTPCAPCKNDVFSVINHEIDIEIPTNSNSPAGSLNWDKQMTWDTMNCNTWVQDRNNYDLNTGAYYTQVGKKAKTGTFISTDENYHWYTIDWYVDNNDYTNNYVAFYFDDPFDPTQKAKDPNGDPLPASPQSPKTSLLHSTRRFIPTRAGRFNFGAWMAWWGYGGKSGGKPNFDTVKVKMAHLSIIPYPASGFNFPQNYDQLGMVCDFHPLYSTSGPGPTPTPPGPPGGGGVPSSNLWWIILIIVAAVILMGLGIWYFVRKRKKKKGKK